MIPEERIQRPVGLHSVPEPAVSHPRFTFIVMCVLKSSEKVIKSLYQGQALYRFKASRVAASSDSGALLLVVMKSFHIIWVISPYNAFSLRVRHGG